MSPSTERNLDMQGFDGLRADEKGRLAAILRWTPAACTSLVVIGLVLQSPFVLGATAAFALLGSLLPNAHPLDLFYNLLAARVFKTGPLPPNPAPRRFAAGIKSLPLGFAALLMQAGYWQAATAIAGILAVVGLIAAVTYWDLGSWIYRRMTAGFASGHARQLAPVVVTTSSPRGGENK